MPRKARRAPFAPALENLEARELLAAAVGGMWPLNDARPDDALVVRFGSDVTAAEESAALNPLSAFVAGVNADGTAVVEVGQGVDISAARARLAANPRVASVLPFSATPTAAAADAASPGASAAQYGVNLNVNSPFATSAAWVDVANIFQAWGQPNAPWTPNANLPLTKTGYPLADAGTTASLTDYPVGDYTLKYQGSGTVKVWGVGQIVGPVTTQSGVSTATVHVDPSQGPTAIDITVTGISATDPVRNIHLYAPGYGANPTQIFTNEFLSRIQPFASIRFMDWLGTNNSNVVNWSDRTAPGNFLKTGPNGVPWESIIALANEADKSIWINVPDQATDAYVKQLADLLRNKLRPDVTVRIEYSNEVWNAKLAEYHRNVANARANPLLDKKDDVGRGAEEYAVRSMQISNIFRTEFGAQSNRFQVELCGQATNTYWLRIGLAYIQAHYGAPSQFFGGIGVAPYIYLDPTVDQAGMTLDQLFASLSADFAGRETTGIVADGALASQYGLALMAYEGGQSLVAFNAKLNANINQDLKLAAQNDPRMGQLYRTLDSVWRANGGGLFQYYAYMSSPSTAGSWGLLQQQSDPGGVKWDTVMSLALPAGDATLDRTVGYSDFLVLKADFGRTGMWWQQGDFNQDGVVNAADFLLMRPNLTGLTTTQAADVAAFAVSIGV